MKTLIVITLIGLAVGGCEECQSGKIRQIESWYIYPTDITGQESDDGGLDEWSLTKMYSETYGEVNALGSASFLWKGYVKDYSGESFCIPNVRAVIRNKYLWLYPGDDRYNPPALPSPLAPIDMPTKIYTNSNGEFCFKITISGWGLDFYKNVRLEEVHLKGDPLYIYHHLGQVKDYGFEGMGGTINFCVGYPTSEIEPFWYNLEPEGFVGETPGQEAISSTLSTTLIPMMTLSQEAITIKQSPSEYPVTSFETNYLHGNLGILACQYNWVSGDALLIADTILASDIKEPNELVDPLPTLVASIGFDNSDLADSNIAVYTASVCSKLNGEIIHEIPCDYHLLQRQGDKVIYRSDYIVPADSKLDMPIYTDPNGNNYRILYCPADAVIELRTDEELLSDFIDNWLSSGPQDFNNDQIINFIDFSAFWR